MTEDRTNTPGKLVRKSNALARARWSPDSVWEPRLVALVAARIKPDDTDFKKYEIPLVDIIGEDKSGRRYQELKSVIDKAMGRVITINEGEDWRKYTLFSSCAYESKRGILKIGFDPDLKGHFLQLKQYMKYNLLEFMLLPSIYSQRIFELLKSWDDRPEVEIELAELHEMLDTPKSFREDFRQFRTRVLEKAHKDILEFTDLNFSWEPIKKGRAVNSIRFMFGKSGKKAKKTLSPVEADAQVEKCPIQSQYNEFLQRFTNSSKSRLRAWKLWSELHENGIAPMAEDVPEGYDMTALEFLKQWRQARL